MGSNQFSSCSSRCDLNGESYIPEPNFDLLSTEKYTLDDLKLIKINGIQIGINNPIDNDSIQEPIYNSNGADSSAPPLINFSQGISGALPDIDEIGKKNYLHCFCLLEAEKLEEKNKGIFIEFGEYDSGNDINDFKVKTFYQSKLGGLRLYVVNRALRRTGGLRKSGRLLHSYGTARAAEPRLRRGRRLPLHWRVVRAAHRAKTALYQICFVFSLISDRPL